MPTGSVHLDHAIVLMAQGRYDLAAGRLRAAIGEDPDDGDGYALLATCLLNQDKLKEAEAAARRSVELQADDAHNLATLAIILQRRNRGREAIEVAKRAVERSPSNGYAWASLAASYAGAGRWPDALAAAESGLADEPGNSDLRSLRSTAMTKLGRSTAVEEARATLAADPGCEVAHANLALALLHAGDRKEAAAHFREALRIDPCYTGARAGLLEAMKARSVVYRPILALYTFAERFTAAQQLVVMGAVFAALYAFKRLAASAPALAPFHHVVEGVAIAAALFIGFGDALVSLVMRFDPVGRYALTRRQSRIALAVGVLAVPLIVTLLGSSFSSNPLWTRGMLVVFPYVGALIVLIEVAQPRQARAADVLLVVGAALGVLFAVDRLIVPMGLAVLWKPYLYLTLFGALAIWAWEAFGEADA